MNSDYFGHGRSHRTQTGIKKTEKLSVEYHLTYSIHQITLYDYKWSFGNFLYEIEII